MAQKLIFHCRLTDFFVSVARLNNAELAGKPLVIHDSAAVPVVIGCSPEARTAGVKEGMSLAMATVRCPGAIILAGDFDACMAYADQVAAMISTLFPVVEKAAAAEYYMEAAATAAECQQLAGFLVQQLSSVYGLPATIGIAGNKTVAALAAVTMQPGTVVHYIAGSGKEFLAPMPIRRLSCSVAGIHGQLIRSGITHVSQLQQMGSGQVRKLFGAGGLELWEKANGMDHTPVLPLSPGTMLHAVSNEGPVTHKAQLLAVAARLVTQLAAALAGTGQLAGNILLNVNDPVNGPEVWSARLPYTCAATAMMEKLAQLIDRKCKERISYDHIAVEITILVSSSYQIDLFSNAITDLNWHQAIRDGGYRNVYVA